MKKYICVILVFVFLLGSFATSSDCFALSDPISLYQLGAIAYGIAQDAGMGFIFSNASSNSVSTYIENQINSYLGSSTLAEKFALEQARYLAGKLVIGQQLYNDVIDFLDYFSNGKKDGDVIMPGEINGIVIDNLNQETGEFGGYTFSGGLGTDSKGAYQFFNVTSGQLIVSSDKAYYNANIWKKTFLGWELVQKNNGYVVNYVLEAKSSWTTDIQTAQTAPVFVMTGTIENQGTVNVSNYVGTAIDVGYQWEGSFGDAPDTNLDQLVGRIYEEVADTNLEVEGEVTDEQVPPTPAPTPIPINPDTPLHDVPWEGLNDLVDQNGKDISDSIGESINDATGTITGAQEGTTAAVQSLEGTLVDALTPPAIDEKTFDLRELFPFCIPFDIYHLLQKFDATPSAPHVQLPIVIPSIGFSYTMDLDFSAWDPVASAMRTVELIVYALGLAWATSKVIKW